MARARATANSLMAQGVSAVAGPLSACRSSSTTLCAVQFPTHLGHELRVDAGHLRQLMDVQTGIVAHHGLAAFLPPLPLLELLTPDRRPALVALVTVYLLDIVPRAVKERVRVLAT